MPTIVTSGCCRLVGNFPITKDGIISLSSRVNFTRQLLQDGHTYKVVSAPTTGTLSISAYTNLTATRYHGCPGNAGVSIPWIMKSDCKVIKFIYGGVGDSYISEYDGDLVRFPTSGDIDNPVGSHRAINASAASGPVSLYEDTTQYIGYGLIYTGHPWYIDTTKESDCTKDLSSALGIGPGYEECHLQSISVQFNPGEVPVVSMEYMYPFEEV